MLEDEEREALEKAAADGIGSLVALEGLQKLLALEAWLSDPQFLRALAATIKGSAKAVIETRRDRETGELRDVDSTARELGNNAAQTVLFLITEPPT